MRASIALFTFGALGADCARVSYDTLRPSFSPPSLLSRNALFPLRPWRTCHASLSLWSLRALHPLWPLRSGRPGRDHPNDGKEHRYPYQHLQRSQRN